MHPGSAVDPLHVSSVAVVETYDPECLKSNHVLLNDHTKRRVCCDERLPCEMSVCRSRAQENSRLARPTTSAMQPRVLTGQTKHRRIEYIYVWLAPPHRVSHATASTDGLDEASPWWYVCWWYVCWLMYMLCCILCQCGSRQTQFNLTACSSLPCWKGPPPPPY